MHDVLPPYLSADEKLRCVEHGGEFWDPEDLQVVNKVSSIFLKYLLKR